MKNLCFTCFLAGGGLLGDWDVIVCDNTGRKCQVCGVEGKFVRNVEGGTLQDLKQAKKEDKRAERKATRTSPGVGWEPEVGKRERPIHLWKRLMEKGY